MLISNTIEDFLVGMRVYLTNDDQLRVPFSANLRVAGNF